MQIAQLPFAPPSSRSTFVSGDGPLWPQPFHWCQPADNESPANPPVPETGQSGDRLEYCQRGVAEAASPRCHFDNCSAWATPYR